ncbi:hypothetical protein [Phenylobacterium sp.]|uniref:hypothetical protein n=1 Tax=Phenylobacterium sp. TaxID=1871053 RepID=UPI0035B44F92
MPQFKVAYTVAAATALLAVAGCGPKAAKTEAAAESTAPLGAVPPNLWRVDVMDGDKVTDTIDICADKDTQAGFIRPAPSVDGKECVRVDDAVETADTYSVRCRVGDQLYRAGSSVTGDQAKDFTVDMAVTRQDEKAPMYEQVRHYTLQGACPAGWRVGDSGKPGATTVTDGVTGQPRALEPAKGE